MSSSSNCDATTWYGDPITLFHNDVQKAKIPTLFKNFEYCIEVVEVDIENDRFTLLAGGADGVCINSLHVNDEQILVGKNNDLSNFEFDQENQYEEPVCLDNKMRTSSLTIQNGQVVESICKGKSYIVW